MGGGRLHKLTIGALWMIAILAMMSTVWSALRAETFSQALIFVAFVYILKKTSTVRWQDKKILVGDIGAAYWASFLILFIGAILALIGFPEAISSYSGRYQGIFNNPNLLGMIAALTLVLGIGCALHNRSLLTWVSLLVPGAQVVLSESRTAMTAVAVAIVWVVVRRGLKSVIAVVYVAFTAVMVTMAFRWDFSFERFQRFTAAEGSGLLNSRTLAWDDVFSYVTSNPLGIGWAVTTSYLSGLRESGSGSGLSSIHNSYLQIIYELGWIGVIPVILILIVLIAVVLRQQTSGIVAGLVAVTIAGGLIQITESAIFGLGQPYPYLFWFAVLAVIVYPTDPSVSTASAGMVRPAQPVE